MTKFVCPGCNRSIDVPRNLLGCWTNCPHCGFGFAAMRDEPDDATAAVTETVSESEPTDSAVHANKDLPGVLGLVFGGIAALCLIPVCLSGGLLGIFFCPALPFAMVGA